jgi:tRNA modification GTPase
MPMGGMVEDTICAVATPVGEGGIGIVRISGPESLTIAERVVRLRSGCALSSTASHTLHLADFLIPSSSGRHPSKIAPGSSMERDVLDEGLAVYMKGPRSFTAEDVVELHCHGSALILARLCEACIAAGARLAQPGEFTKRAFLNGRLDLSQAEAVLDTIRARSERGLKVAQRHLRGDLGREVDRLRTHLLTILAQVEAGIDFVEEDIAFVERTELLNGLQETMEAIDHMLNTAQTGRLLRDGARVVIVGLPNVGKSSLLNSLLKENRAIVTNVPGTTRDLIEESVVWQGLLITLVDTAGIRETADVVEAEGIRRTKFAQGDADLTLQVVDSEALLAAGAVSTELGSEPGQAIVVVSKIDLLDDDQRRQVTDTANQLTGIEVVPVSTITGVGLEQLKAKIRGRLLRSGGESDQGVSIANLRHCTALDHAREALQHAREAAQNGLQPDLIAVDLRAAADALGEITGAITTEEMLERIFSEFCIGK